MLSITLAQINPTVGDISGNAEKILSIWRDAQTDLVVFPELVLSGYPPEDLILNPGFISLIEREVHALCEKSQFFDAAALVCCPWEEDGKVYNAALLVHNGEIVAKTYKHHLPNYGVFDEKRVFTAGPMPNVMVFKDLKLGVMICEDMWLDDVALHLHEQNADILIVPNGSPFEPGKLTYRMGISVERAQNNNGKKYNNTPLIYVNQVGGQDELVFDGGSFVYSGQGVLLHLLPEFEECTYGISFNRKDDGYLDAVHNPDNVTVNFQDEELIYEALKLGLRDYVLKNGFSKVLLGLSGGIDSALTAAIAVDALGAENVRCIMLPSPFTSDESLEDAKACAEMIGTSYEIFEINAAMKAFESTIPDLDGIAHENMQSRTRGLILMALSNDSGEMLLTTGNKSEMAVGYATLYGDMNGGFNPLKDVYKTKVYELAKWRNEQTPVIPERIISKAPSAELREDQTDQDSLPPYDVLDDILEGLIEKQENIEIISKRGHDLEIIQKVAQLLRISEYKRYQAPPGIKITSRSFGRDRRYPLTNRYKFD